MNTMRKFLSLACVVVAICAASGAKADLTFGQPVNLGPVMNSSRSEYNARSSANGLAMLFGRGADGLWTTRATQDDAWGAPARYWPFDTSGLASVAVWPGVTTADGLEMYGSETSPTGYGGSDIVVSTRKTTADNWGPVANLGSVVNSSADEILPTVSADGLELYFSGYWTNARPGGCGNADLWVTKRATRDAAWGVPENLGATINSAYQDARPFLSGDGLVLFFDSMRPGGYGQGDLYMTRRASTAGPWGKPVNLGPIVNSRAFEELPCVSPDGSTLFFDANRPGGYGNQDLWQASVEPGVDLNQDGTVDENDQAILTEQLGRSDSFADVGPMPWGDGVVDDADLAVLTSHWGRLPVDPTLTARWALDETDENVACDSAGDCHATVYGGALWTPVQGREGTLQLDGIDDCVGTPFVVNPADGPFRVSLWVQGGSPGQVILSQKGGKDWLWASSDGGLPTTSLDAALGRVGLGLVGKNSITDGQWHQVGLSWDGFNRVLYMDGTQAARDTKTYLPSSDGGLCIGAGWQLASGSWQLASDSFWSGLIDEVCLWDVTTPEKPAAIQDTTGFEIYADDLTPDVFYFGWVQDGVLDFFSTTDPHEGNYCIHCTEFVQYNAIGFDFWPDRDMSQLVAEGYLLEFWVRGDSHGARFDVWFVDTKTGEPGERAWRQGRTISESLVAWDGQWKQVRLPLAGFTSFGSWDEDNRSSAGPQAGMFDWSAVDYFMIASQYHAFTGMHFWFDSIRVTQPE